MEPISRATKFGVAAVTLAVGYPMIHFCYFPVYRREPKVENRVAIVTGASGNLGRAICYQLAQRKVRVIMACRDMDKCKVARREIVLYTNHKGIACRHLDLEDVDSINRFVKEMEKTEPHIDILINNAGVKNVEKKEMTKYGIEKNFFVNFIAPFLLTFRLMDQLKKSASITRDSRIINVVGTPRKDWNVDLDDINFEKRRYNPRVAYKQSKMALGYFTVLLDKINREQKNQVYVYATSPVSFNIGEVFNRPIGTFENLTYLFLSYFPYHPMRVTGATIACALEPHLAKPKESGKLYSYFYSSWSWAWSRVTKDEIKAKKVWNYAANALLTIPDKVETKSKTEDKNETTATRDQTVSGDNTSDKEQQVSVLDKKDSDDLAMNNK